MKLSDPVLHEVFEQWPAWQVIVETVTVHADARTVDPKLIDAELNDLTNEGWNRLAHLMIGHGHAECLSDAVLLLTELRAYAACGRRPRFGAEAGFTLKDFEEMRP